MNFLCSFTLAVRMKMLKRNVRLKSNMMYESRIQKICLSETFQRNSKGKEKKERKKINCNLSLPFENEANEQRYNEVLDTLRSSKRKRKNLCSKSA